MHPTDLLDPLQTDPTPPGMDAAEWAARLELAACYRVFDLLGWDEMIFNHITARLGDGTLLINPFGLAYAEVTASNLVRIDLDGTIIGHSDWPINPAGLVIHSAVHAARPDAHCVMHTHTTAGSAVACLRDGLDRNNFYSAQIDGQVGYHDFEGIAVNPDEKVRLIESLGANALLILRNHGLLAVGRSVPQAFARLWTLQRACEIQLAAQGSGRPLQPITDHARQQCVRESFQISDDPTAGADMFAALRRRVNRLDPSYRS